MFIPIRIGIFLPTLLIRTFDPNMRNNLIFIPTFVGTGMKL